MNTQIIPVLIGAIAAIGLAVYPQWNLRCEVAQVNPVAGPNHYEGPATELLMQHRSFLGFSRRSFPAPGAASEFFQLM